MVAEPTAFGLLDASNPCLEILAAGVCADPSQYLFWDGIHPTSGGGHRTVAELAIRGVPEPGTIALLSFGLIGLVLRRRA